MYIILYSCFVLSLCSDVWGYIHDLAAASVDKRFCCGSTDYSTLDYRTQCINGKDFPVDPIASCATCVAYQCLDWTVGSNGNAAREASFFAETNMNVYFGVGSYGSNVNGGGLCYRMTTNSIDRDLIVQIINYGSDVPAGNFDLQVAAGGHGIYDACTAAGTKMPQFNGSADAWGVLLILFIYLF